VLVLLHTASALSDYQQPWSGARGCLNEKGKSAQALNIYEGDQFRWQTEFSILKDSENNGLLSSKTGPRYSLLIGIRFTYDCDKICFIVKRGIILTPAIQEWQS
jgi:hypothetical protein